MRLLSRLTPEMYIPPDVTAVSWTELSRGAPMPGVCGSSSVPGVFSCAMVRCWASYATITGTSAPTVAARVADHRVDSARRQVRSRDVGDGAGRRQALLAVGDKSRATADVAYVYIRLRRQRHRQRVGRPDVRAYI